MRRIALLLSALALGGMMLAPAADAKKKKKKKVQPVSAMAASAQVAPEQTGTAVATCPAKKTLVGGGFGAGPLAGLAAVDDFGTLVFESRREGARSWRVSALNYDDDHTGTVVAYAYCRKKAKPLTEAMAAISNQCSCLPVMSAVATCPSNGRAVAGGFRLPFDLNEGGAWVQGSYRFGAFAWRVDGVDVSLGDGVITAYAYCAPKARTETNGVRVIRTNPDTETGSGTAYAQRCKKRGQRMLAGGFRTESFTFNELQLVSQHKIESGRFATTVTQSGAGFDGTLQSFGYCG